MLVYQKRSTVIFLVSSFAVSGLLLRVLLTDFDSFGYDALLYYEYVSTLAFQGKYPDTATELHNLGWVFFLVPFFKAIGPYPEKLFLAQHMISIALSTLTVPISYLFAKRFLPANAAIFVPVLFAIDFRMAQNAGFGITEPLVMVLSLAAYQSRQRIWMFVFVGLACLVRFEAIMMIPVLFVIHRDKRMLPYAAIPFAILLILFAVNSSLDHSDQVVSKITHEMNFVKSPSNNVTPNLEYWTQALSNSLVYMVWAAFPVFVFSIYGMHQKRYLLVVIGILSVSGIYAYIDAYDTRYFFPMYPFLAVASAMGLERITRTIFYRT